MAGYEPAIAATVSPLEDRPLQPTNDSLPKIIRPGPNVPPRFYRSRHVFDSEASPAAPPEHASQQFQSSESCVFVMLCQQSLIEALWTRE